MTGRAIRPWFSCSDLPTPTLGFWIVDLLRNSVSAGLSIVRGDCRRDIGCGPSGPARDSRFDVEAMGRPRLLERRNREGERQASHLRRFVTHQDLQTLLR
jgi:hypothetical protein